MANVIKIKRKPKANGAGVPNSLVAGELAFSEADAKLYYGLDDNGVTPIEIAGSGYVLAKISENAPTKSGSGATGTWNISITGNAGTVTSGVYTGRTLTAGSGLAGGGDLSADRTFNIGQGDGISVGADSIAVDSTVVRTTGMQSISGGKTFVELAVFNSGVETGSIYNDGPLIIGVSEPSIGLKVGNTTTLIVNSGLAEVSGNLTVTGSGLLASNINNFHTAVRTNRLDEMSAPAANVSFNGNKITNHSEPTDSSDVATKYYVDSLLSANDAMVFKGTIGTGGTVTALPTTHSAGWAYRVITAGTYAGKVCEIGDLIIAVVDRSGSSNTNDDWTVAQTNIDGAVVGPASATTNNFALFDGTSGKLIKDGGFGSGVFAPVSHSHGNMTNSGAIGSTANLPIITTTNGVLTTGSFGTTANTFCQGNDSRLSDTRNTTNALTVNNAGAGDASSFTFNGSAAKTISYNSIGAPSISGANATGTWNIAITGNAGTVTNGVYTTGSQTINGAKTFGNQATFGSGIVSSGTNSIQAAATASTATQFAVFTSSPASSAQSILTRTPSQVLADIGAAAGPASATNNNFALFDGTTGKLIKDAGFASTTVGQNLVSLTNPSAVTFLKINANNTVSTESASTFRSSLGANTVGSNIFTLTNPSAISFIRINADNTVTARSASELKTDLSLNNVENTALSTWAGSTSITTLGTIASGTWSATTIAVDKGGTGQTSYTNGQLLIGNTTGNTLTKATLTQGTGVVITNGAGSITVAHNDTSLLNGLQGGNGISSITVDDFGHVTAVGTATYLTSATVCSAIADCTIDGGTF